MINDTRIIALCTSRANDNETYNFISTLNSLLVKQNWRIFVYHICSDYYWSSEDLSPDAAVYELIDYDIVDAIIIMDERIKSSRITNNIINNANKHQIPVFLIDKQNPNCYNFYFDYENGFETVVRHIVEEHGIRSLHFMAGIKGNEFSDTRLEIFKKVLAENNIKFSDDMVSYGLFWADPAREATHRLVKKGNLPKAIICANDIMAINVCSVLEEYGYSIPRDILVTGFDGIDEVFFMEPQITTAKCDYENLAGKVYQVLLDHFLGWKADKDNKIIPEFKCGQSCGCNNKQSIKDVFYYKRMNTRFYRYQDDVKTLSNLSQRLQNNLDFRKISILLDDPVLEDISIYINQSCSDETKNTENLRKTNTFDEDFIVIHNSIDTSLDGEIIERQNVYKDIDKLFSREVPIIFNAIYSLDTLFGFIMFYYKQPTLTNFGKITQTVTSLSIGVGGYVNIRNQKYLRKQLEHIYKVDSLTGLLNRSGFEAEFAIIRETTIASHEYFTAILSDSDGLKYINDTYGHITGDKAIAAVATAIKEACPDKALCVRIGGDEIMAVIPGKCDIDEIVRRINLGIELFNARKEIPCSISTSLGTFRTHLPAEMNFDTFVSRTDKEMYEMKKLHHSNI